MVKKLILVTSPPACGKTYISKALAKRLQHVVYLDKDTLITLSKQIFVVRDSLMTEAVTFLKKISVTMSTSVLWIWLWKHWIMTILY